MRREDLTPEVVEAGVKKLQLEFEAKHKMVPVARVSTLSDFEVLEGTHAMQFAVLDENEAVQDLAAEFQQCISDYSDLAREMEPLERHESRKQALELVRELAKLGCAVSIGTSDNTLRLANGASMPMHVAHVVVTPASQAKPFITVPLSSLRL